MEKSARLVLKLDRLLLALYLVALIGLLMLPISGADRLISIGGDKLIHVALFGGLSIFLRWNLSATRNAVVYSVAIASVIVVGTELAQSLVSYRSAELWDVAAGLVGAILGAVSMNRVMLSSTSDGFVGFLVTMLGLLVGALFVFADVIGVGTNNYFGPSQIVGTALGALIIAGGVWVCVRSRRDESRLS